MAQVIKHSLSPDFSRRASASACQTYSSDQRVLVEATGLYTYPDVVILCGPGAFDLADRDTLTNPVALIEVLSPTTERYDRGAKFRNYPQVPSLVEYVLMAQDEAVRERYVREVDSSWALVSFVGFPAVQAFASIQARIPLADVYAGVVLPDSERR